MSSASNKMKVFRLPEPFKLEMAETEIDFPKEGEVLLKVRRIGLCGSDLRAYRGQHPFLSYPRILGHELGCEVMETGKSVSKVRVGDKVCVEPLMSCGQCYPCRIGRYNCCTNLNVLGIHLDGGMCEYLKVPIQNVYKGQPHMSFDELALCETISIGAHAVKRGKVRNGEYVAVIGVGPIGMGALQVAKAYGAQVVAIDINDRNLRLAKKLGADEVVNPNYETPKMVVLDLTQSEGVQVAIEAAGKAATVQMAVDLVSAAGRVVIIGLGEQEVALQPHVLVKKEIDLLGSRNSRDIFPEVIALVATGKVNMLPLVSHRFPFEKAVEAFEFWHQNRREVIKILLEINSSSNK